VAWQTALSPDSTSSTAAATHAARRSAAMEWYQRSQMQEYTEKNLSGTAGGFKTPLQSSASPCGAKPLHSTIASTAVLN